MRAWRRPWFVVAAGVALVFAAVTVVALLSTGHSAGHWLPVLGGGDRAADTALARRTREIASSLQAFFTTHSATFAIVLAAPALTGAALALVARSRRRRPDDQPARPGWQPTGADAAPRRRAARS